jgi:glycine dehydrogenase
MSNLSLHELEHHGEFIERHIGVSETQQQEMLSELGCDSLEALIADTVPAGIRRQQSMDLPEAVSERDTLAYLKDVAQRNKIFQSFIGMGYHDTLTPNVILRNVLENPGWYTAYTPYQPEIAQGRLEGLLNFQQMITDLTGMELANASMLDEATAAAEAMSMSKRVARKNKSNVYFVDAGVHPQTIAVIQTRAAHFGFEVVVANAATELADVNCFGALIQYPTSTGNIEDIKSIIDIAHSKDVLVTVAADILSLVLLKAPGDLGADIVIGSAQRFGVPMGFGGPHAAFFAFRDAYKRASAGRIIGVSVDTRGKKAFRMAMQTREQHIRREKANSNICTSQVLLALMAGFYGVYHGPKGLKRIAQRVNRIADLFALALESQGFELRHKNWFDTLTVETGERTEDVVNRALEAEMNVRVLDGAIGLSFHEKTTLADLDVLIGAFTGEDTDIDWTELDAQLMAQGSLGIQSSMLRDDEILTHDVFNLYHSETEMLRYLARLEKRDIALNHSMIALGSCTMKLNATVEMIPVTWPEFGALHPFAPIEQAEGYLKLFEELEKMLCEATGYDNVSLQPNAGSQGEYAGLIAIKKYHESRGDHHRDVCLIPASAHGTNPASAQMVSMRVVVVACDDKGNVDMDDLRAKVEQHSENLAAIMVTYPSTHGVFEESITELCDLIHEHGGQVYVDGANMNALVGVSAPGHFGGDVSHLNLHKTFCIPHGGGGPGMGPIGVKSHLAPFLAGHPLQHVEGTKLENGVISAAPWGSASILPISWAYIKLMGAEGLKAATETAILSANYLAKHLAPHFPVLYTGTSGRVAHECLIDIRPLKEATGVSEEDVAKRLMDFGFHSPTMSFPVAGTLMIEPTESESKFELDNFVTAMATIRAEADAVGRGEYPTDNNPLCNAPHTQADILGDWDRPYSREKATYPADFVKAGKTWPTANRIDNVFGDRNLICSCPPLEHYLED